MVEKIEVYMDNSATTKPYDEVIETMVDAMKNYYGNPSSAHIHGIRGEKKLNEAREIIAKTLNCTKDEIIFTSGGSESNNFLIGGFAKKGVHMITSSIEHPSVLNTFKELENQGVRVTYLNTDSSGSIKLDELANSITKDTVLVSIMHVNNEIGIIQDINTIGKIIKEKSSRAKFHVDAIQSYGKLDIDVKRDNIDLLSISGHKIHGPKGIGAAYIKKGLNPKPLIYGGGQERKLRSGTENLPAIAGFAVAADKKAKNLKENFHKVQEVKQYFIDKLKDIDDIRINSKGAKFSPYILSVSFKGVRGEVLLHALENEGIYVSTGSACSSRLHERSHSLEAIGLTEEEMEGTIRFSFSEYNSKKEVDYVIEVLKKSLNFLRRLRK
ncbi:Cysteine desulfurase [Clostridium thermopalmarium DSM 5974]|uniref:Cysteine desulfurase n=1 Tax=Clostridium thermopalmarium DSM 5974 TaxID=1121340 RepID=A0A2T0APG3_9CLOT|nr:Cysteine desulfurase [Clostridium thermopalmarium DSM 5974]PVZ28715.1 cysteine desulfurase [Clostridium thermopalmarium DSM 5974]